MNFDQIYAGLMTISDLQKYEIVLYTIFWPIILFPHIARFYIWASAPEELSARPCYLVDTSSVVMNSVYKIEGGICFKLRTLYWSLMVKAMTLQSRHECWGSKCCF